MKRVIAGLIAAILALVPLAQGVCAAEEIAKSTSRVAIRQAYFGSMSDATDEFVTVANYGSDSVEISGYTLEYKAATGKSWYEKAKVGSGITLAAGEDYVFATKRERDAEMGSGFAQGGGNVRLVSASGAVLDALAWGAGDSPEAVAATAPTAGNALSRKLDDAGVVIDTESNSADFEITNIDASATVINSGEPTPELQASTLQSNADAQIEITEIFPDPTSPATDSSDEFIELFNAGSETASLIGWKLQDDAGHTAKLDGVTLVSGQYLALMSSQTKLSLNNSGDVISLINSAGEVVMATPSYGAAKEGLTFGTSANGWGWLAMPTPNAVNSALASVEAVSVAGAKTKAKKATAKAATKKKTKSAKAKTPKLAKTASAAGANTGADLVDTQAETVPWTWLVAGLGLIAVGYGVYEYRPEITSFITKLRAKLSTRS